MKDDNKKIEIIIFLTILILAIIVHFYVQNKDSKIQIQPTFIVGTIKSAVSSNSDFRIYLNYNYKNQNYTSGSDCPKDLYPCIESKKCFGDSILIKLSKLHPNVSVAIPGKRAMNMYKKWQSIILQPLNTKASIKRMHMPNQSWKQVVYEYKYDDELYEKYDKCPPSLVPCFYDKKCLGDSIDIILSKKNPSNSKVIFEKKIYQPLVKKFVSIDEYMDK